MAPGLVQAKVYSFASVDFPGAAQSGVYDSDGTTTVGACRFDPPFSPVTAFVFTNGIYQTLDVPNSAESFATGINANGLIVGWYTDLAGERHGFANNGATFSPVDFPGARSTQPQSVNDSGEIVGTYTDSAGGEHGFVSSGGTFTAIDFPGAIRTFVGGINAAGHMVGITEIPETPVHGFLLQDGVFTPIKSPLGVIWALGINDTGEIAGNYWAADFRSHGFTYAGGTFSTVDVAGARGTQLTEIKNGGQVIGLYFDALEAPHGLTGRGSVA
jgi:probable HAF family extracellular repeat protein